MKASVNITTKTAIATLLIAVPASAGLNLDFSDGTRGPARKAEIFGDASDFKPQMTIIDDAILGGGNALRIESAGGGSEWYIPFDSSVTLGPNVGDKIVVSLDFRVDLSEDTIATATSDLHFGIFNDNDGSLGQAFGTQIDGLTPAIFGVDDGHFDTTTGPIAPDFGIHSRMSLNLNVPNPNEPLALLNARVRNETEGDTGVLSGSGDTIASPGSPPVLSESENGITEGGNNWGALRDGSANTITMTIERTFEVVPDGIDPEDAYRGTLSVTNALGTTTMSGRDPISQLDRETFHYMVFENVNGNFDYIVDNISVMEVPAGGGLIGDFNEDTVVDQADIDLLTAAIRAGSTDTDFDLDGQNGVDAGDLDEMIATVLGTVPGDANLDGNVDLIDLSALATNFNLVAGWAGGNSNIDTVVDLIDLSLLATNFGTTAAVPEPALAGILGLGALGLTRRR
ncbi:MAG: hypothetical protein RIG82_09825 [Phycisphaeraceae bacterium]